jgi:cell wall-associated NlpC family hydrolase
MARRPDWPERLAAAVDAARGKPYVLGENDCLRLACAAVQALTDDDYWPRFAGYKTKRQALARIARVAPSLGEAVTSTLGVSPSPTASAWRGDIVLFRDERGEDHLGVCLGRQVVLMAAEGTLLMGREHPGLLCSWRIG